MLPMPDRKFCRRTVPTWGYQQQRCKRCLAVRLPRQPFSPSDRWMPALAAFGYSRYISLLWSKLIAALRHTSRPIAIERLQLAQFCLIAIGKLLFGAKLGLQFFPRFVKVIRIFKDYFQIQAIFIYSLNSYILPKTAGFSGDSSN
jgi:hypothetical protein